mmetsp:Transcript_29916/g.44189  ORF Transcript_29916/g.44189 Transcript_29916/m.44189 type:complete len:80 (-) Transcript_29916:78-317(-)
MARRMELDMFLVAGTHTRRTTTTDPEPIGASLRNTDTAATSVATTGNRSMLRPKIVGSLPYREESAFLLVHINPHNTSQ